MIEGNPIRRIRRQLIEGPGRDLTAFLRTRGPPHPLLVQRGIASDHAGDEAAAEENVLTMKIKDARHYGTCGWGGFRGGRLSTANHG